MRIARMMCGLLWAALVRTSDGRRLRSARGRSPGSDSDAARDRSGDQRPECRSHGGANASRSDGHVAQRRDLARARCNRELLTSGWSRATSATSTSTPRRPRSTRRRASTAAARSPLPAAARRTNSFRSAADRSAWITAGPPPRPRSARIGKLSRCICRPTCSPTRSSRKRSVRHAMPGRVAPRARRHVLQTPGVLVAAMEQDDRAPR